MALKHTTPSAPAPSASDTTPYQHIVRDVLAQARPLMERVAEATRMSLLTRQDQARTPGEHNAMHEARQQLSRLASVMGERYPDALRKALDQEGGQNQEKPTRPPFTVHFDRLELMEGGGAAGRPRRPGVRGPGPGPRSAGAQPPAPRSLSTGAADRGVANAGHAAGAARLDGPHGPGAGHGAAGALSGAD